MKKKTKRKASAKPRAQTPEIRSTEVFDNLYAADMDQLSTLFTYMIKEINPSIDMGMTYEILYNAFTIGLGADNIESIGREIRSTANTATKATH